VNGGMSLFAGTANGESGNGNDNGGEGCFVV
jgi:hypothetical protein